ncbi:hypothetical protein [Ammoniphilus sp. CFH 90114]|nr:hypothetical protein [Ammoniphilus sp. CFH 90114]
MSEMMSEFVKIIVVAEVVFAVCVSLTAPFLPKIMQRWEQKKAQNQIS